MKTDTFYCLYCAEHKPMSELTEEHAIPQFMGGRYAPQHYLLNACKTCNSRLGLFVDAAYAKSWFVTNYLADSAKNLYLGLDDEPVPLTYIGVTDSFNEIIKEKDHIVENWLGPSGETVLWLRNHDERFYWYAGGDPIRSKKNKSTAYLFMNSLDQTRFQMGVASFLSEFKGRKNARKILCCKFYGEDVPEDYIYSGFDKPNEQDEFNIKLLHQHLRAGKNIHGQIVMNLKFDHRFLSKMVLSVGTSLFGDEFLKTSFASEAQKGCWYKDGEAPKLSGTSSMQLSQEKVSLLRLIGYHDAVSIAIVRDDSHYVLLLNIDNKLPAVVTLAPSSLSSSYIDPNEGYMLLLFPHLKKSIELSLADFIAYQRGGKKHLELDEIIERRRKALEFMKELKPIHVR